MTAIAEGKGLSQIRSSNDNEDYPKLGSEPTSSSRVANPINASLVQDSGATEDLPDETSEGIRVEESLQSTATILTSPSEDSHNAVRSLEVKPNRSMNGRVIDQRRTRSDTIVNDNLAIEAGGDNDSSTQADGPAASIGNEAGRWQESKPERNDEEIFAHGDIIDYEGEEEQARVTSSGSSTLQGDHLDSATDGPLATSDKGLPSEEVPAHIGLGAGVLTRQLTDDPAGDKANLSNGDSQNASQVLENDAASADYFEEQYENTSDSHYEEANDQENNDEEVKDGEFRNEEYEGENEDEDVDEGGDEDEGDEDGEILEVLGNGGRPQSADAFRVLDANDFEDAASAPQKDKADLVQADVWHDQEYGVTVSDGVLKSKSSNKERAEWAYRHELSQDDHDTSGIPQSDHQIILDHIQESIEIGHATNTSAESNGSQLPSNTDLKAETWAKSSDQVQDDDDEITYEDDENKGATRDDPVNTDHNATSSPNSLKRARGFQDLDEASEAEIQGKQRFSREGCLDFTGYHTKATCVDAKRFRSG